MQGSFPWVSGLPEAWAQFTWGVFGINYFTKNLEQMLRVLSHTCSSMLGRQRKEDQEKFRASLYTQQIPGYSGQYCKSFAQRGKNGSGAEFGFHVPIEVTTILRTREELACIEVCSSWPWVPLAAGV